MNKPIVVAFAVVIAIGVGYFIFQSKKQSSEVVVDQPPTESAEPLTTFTTTELQAMDVPSQARYIQKAALESPRNPAALEWLVSLLKTPEFAGQIHENVIRQLSAIKSKELIPFIDGFVKSEDLSMRIAAIEALPQVCPSNLWAIAFERAAQEKTELGLRRLLDILTFLKGPKANELLEKVATREPFKKALKSKIEEARLDLKTPPITNNCQM